MNVFVSDLENTSYHETALSVIRKRRSVILTLKSFATRREEELYKCGLEKSRTISSIKIPSGDAYRNKIYKKQSYTHRIQAVDQIPTKINKGKKIKLLGWI